MGHTEEKYLATLLLRTLQGIWISRHPFPPLLGVDLGL